MGRGKGIFEGTPVVEMQRWQERTFPDQAPVRDTLPEPILRLNALAKEIQRERDELEILESKERNNFLVLNQICMWQLLQEYIQVQPSNPALVEQATVVIDLFKKRTRLDPFIGVVREVCNLKGKPFLAAELELVRRVKSSSSRISQVLSIILTKLASIIPKCTAAAIEGVCRPHMSECDGGPEDEPFKHPATALSKRKLVIFHTEVDTSDLLDEEVEEEVVNEGMAEEPEENTYLGLSFLYSMARSLCDLDVPEPLGARDTGKNAADAGLYYSDLSSWQSCQTLSFQQSYKRLCKCLNFPHDEEYPLTVILIELSAVGGDEELGKKVTNALAEFAVCHADKILDKLDLSSPHDATLRVIHITMALTILLIVSLLQKFSPELLQNISLAPRYTRRRYCGASNVAASVVSNISGCATTGEDVRALTKIQKCLTTLHNNFLWLIPAVTHWLNVSS